MFSWKRRMSYSLNPVFQNTLLDIFKQRLLSIFLLKSLWSYRWSLSIGSCQTNNVSLSSYCIRVDEIEGWWSYTHFLTIYHKVWERCFTRKKNRQVQQHQLTKDSNMLDRVSILDEDCHQLNLRRRRRKKILQQLQNHPKFDQTTSRLISSSESPCDSKLSEYFTKHALLLTTESPCERARKTLNKVTMVSSCAWVLEIFVLDHHQQKISKLCKLTRSKQGVARGRR